MNDEAKQVVRQLVEHLTGQATFDEDKFCGSANVILDMSGDRIGADSHPDLILLLTAVQDGSFAFPQAVSEADYQAAVRKFGEEATK